ncbi:MAG: hypothetical protein WCP09_04190, partial [Candidatus Taylorbacteria bacterium]
MNLFHINNIVRIKIFIVFFVILVGIFSISIANIRADTGAPSIISYQGRLTDSSGNLLGGNGTPYYFKFSFWDSPTVGQGTKLWPTSSPSAISISVKQGVFGVNIGDTENG